MTPKKPDWFELTENGDSYTGIQKINKKLPIATLVVAGAVILGGSIFANANNENSIPAQNSSMTQGVATSTPAASAEVSGVSATSTSINPAAVKSVSTVNGLPMPVVTNVAQRDDDDEHEGRERGSRERDHDDDDDDRHEDEDDD
jgi:hypothetical protein